MIHRSMDKKKKKKKKKKKAWTVSFMHFMMPCFPSRSMMQRRAARKGHAMIAQLMSSFSARTGGGPPWSEAAPAPDDILRFCCWYTCRSLSISSFSAS